MSNFLQFITPEVSVGSPDLVVASAQACIERFSSAFNSRDLHGMDAELHFPHVMFSGSAQLIWPGPGQHPPDLFYALRSVGWAKSVYLDIAPVAVASGKVHFLVTYERQGADGNVISSHVNLWIVKWQNERWGIALRSC